MTVPLLSVLLVAASLTATYASYFQHRDCYRPSDVLEKYMVEGEEVEDDHEQSGYGHKPVCSGQKFVLKKFKINVTDYYGNSQMESCEIPEGSLDPHGNSYSRKTSYRPRITYIKCNEDNCNQNYGYYSSSVARCVPTIQSVYLQAICTPIDTSATTTASTTSGSTATTVTGSTATTVTGSTATSTTTDDDTTATSVSTTTTPTTSTVTIMGGRRKRFARPSYYRSIFHEPFFNKHNFGDFGSFDSQYRHPKRIQYVHPKPTTYKPTTTTVAPTTSPRPRRRSVTIKLPTFCNCKFFDC